MKKVSYIVMPVLEDDSSCIRSQPEDVRIDVTASSCTDIGNIDTNWNENTQGVTFDSSLILTTRDLDLSHQVKENNCALGDPIIKLTAPGAFS